LALSVPLSRFTSRVGGGSAFFVRPHDLFRDEKALMVGEALGDLIFEKEGVGAGEVGF